MLGIDIVTQKLKPHVTARSIMLFSNYWTFEGNIKGMME
jgi:hypothetical protein